MLGGQDGAPGIRQLMNILRADNGVAELMRKPAYGDDGAGNPAVSQADLVADMLNFARLDVKRMGEEAGVDIEVTRMEPETAAVLIQKLVKGESLELIDKFNEIEDLREQVLAAQLSDEELEEHRELKKSVSYSLGAVEEAGGDPEAMTGATPDDDDEEEDEEVDDDD